jgi:2-phosphoglycerate kinase
VGVLSDRLTLTRALESSGMASDAAERIATEIYGAIHDNVATKQDLRELELRLEAKIDRIVVRLGALIVIVAGLASTIMHFWR